MTQTNDAIGNERRQQASGGFDRFVALWLEDPSNLLNQGYWHGANALETYVDYLVAVNARDTNGIIQQSYQGYCEYRPAWPATQDYYFDDQGWWGIALLKAYNHPQLSDCDVSPYLDAAVDIWDIIDRNAWNTAYCGPSAWWRWVFLGPGSGHGDYKNSIINELFFVLSVRLYEATNEDKYLTRAREVRQWLFTCGVIGPNGLVRDGLNSANEDPPCGTSEHQDTWTYNQGVLLGGLVDLARIDDDPRAIEQAKAIARAVASNLTYEGVLMESCCESSIGTNDCNSDAAQFKGIFIRYLGYANQLWRDPVFDELIRDSAAGVWACRGPNDQFGQVWFAPFSLPGLPYPGFAHIDLVTLQTSGLDALVAALDLPN